MFLQYGILVDFTCTNWQYCKVSKAPHTGPLFLKLNIIKVVTELKKNELIWFPYSVISSFQTYVNTEAISDAKRMPKYISCF